MKEEGKGRWKRRGEGKRQEMGREGKGGTRIFRTNNGPFRIASPSLLACVCLCCVLGFNGLGWIGVDLSGF